MDNQTAIRSELKTELLQRVEALGRQSLFPTDSVRINEIVQQLADLNPISSPLHLEHRSLLLGHWQLVYASRGTVVTRQLVGWSGVAIEQVWQTLSGHEAQTIAATNGAKLSLPIIGTWQLQAQGSWMWDADEQVARVTFDGFSVQAVGLFSQPTWALPEVRIPVLEWLRNEALWQTSYLDQDLRIGQGATKNLFVFHRVGSA